MVGSQDTAILMENLCVLHHKEGGSVTVAVGFSDRQHMTHDTLQMTSDTRLYNKNTNHKYIYIFIRPGVAGTVLRSPLSLID